MITAFHNGHVTTPTDVLKNHAVLVERGRITAIVDAGSVPQDSERVDLGGGILLPGYIDVQVNGGGGVLFNATPTVDGLAAIAAAHARFGMTGLMPTIISTDIDSIAQAIMAVDTAIAQGVVGILGIHIEGPYLSPKRRGIHNPKEFPVLDDAAITVLSSLKNGKTMVTLAPDAVSTEAISKLTEAGVLVCIGHSDADYETVSNALAAGACGFTHLFNAMSPLTTRAPGVVGAALDDRTAWCGLITDGHHVHPATARVAYACRGADKIMLVTDAMPPAASDMTSFELQGRTIRVENGVCVGPDGTLAGAAADMATVVKTASEMLSIRDPQIIAKLSSTNAAAFLGLQGERGSIEVGARADFVLTDADFSLRRTYIGGKAL